MRSKNIRNVIPLVGVLAVTVAVACGGGSSAPTPTPTTPAETTPTPIPTTPAALTPIPTSPAVPTPTPTTPAALTPVPTSPAAPTPTQQPTATPDVQEDGAFTWEIENVDTGTKPALALTSDDVPYVAYMLEAMSGFVKNAVRNGPSWDISTVATGYFYGPLDIAIGPDDVAHISYHDHEELTFEPDKGDAAYAVLRDGQWTVEAVFDQGHDGWDNRLAIDANGRPHISAIDPQEFGGNGVEYYHQDDSGEWTVENVVTEPLTYKYATSIAIDPDGNPHISYHDQRDKDLALASRDDSGWTKSVIDSDGDTGLFSSLVIDDEGRFHISYFQKSSSSSGAVKYATRDPDDASWEVREVDTLNALTFGFVGARNSTSLTLDSQGNPWIAYSDEKLLKLAIWDGSDWQIETVVEEGSETLGQLVSLKLDSEDRPHVAYFEVTDKRPLNGRVKYAMGTPN